MSGEDLEVRPVAGEDQWQPIETYPNNGRQVLLYTPRLETPGKVHCEQQLIGFRYPQHVREDKWLGAYLETWPIKPTHWHPLPSPPRSCAVFPPPPNN